jgi:hypothetical protein
VARNHEQGEISRRALTDLERPYLFVLDYNWRLADPAESGGLEPGWVYTVANGGKLPAFIKNVRLGIKIGGSTVPPDMRDEPPVHELLTAPLIESSERRKVVQKFVDDENAQAAEIRGGKAMIAGSVLKAGQIIVKISIYYDGPITTGHATTACWEWHPVKHAQYGGPEHNERT